MVTLLATSPNRVTWGPGVGGRVRSWIDGGGGGRIGEGSEVTNLGRIEGQAQVN